MIVDYEASENYQIVADDYFKKPADFEAISRCL